MRPSLKGAPWAWEITRDVYAGAQAATEVIAAPGSTRLFIHSLLITNALADVLVTISLGSQILLDVTVVAATGTAFLEFPFEAPVAGAAGEALTVTTDGGCTLMTYSSSNDQT